METNLFKSSVLSAQVGKKSKAIGESTFRLEIQRQNMMTTALFSG